MTNRLRFIYTAERIEVENLGGITINDDRYGIVKRIDAIKLKFNEEMDDDFRSKHFNEFNDNFSSLIELVTYDTIFSRNKDIQEIENEIENLKRNLQEKEGLQKILKEKEGL